MIEEEFYELAYEEIESGNLKKGLWAKAFSKSDGDENKAKALYIKYRFDQIKEGHKEIDEEEDVGIDSKIKPEKKIIEPKKESQDEFVNRLKGQPKPVNPSSITKGPQQDEFIKQLKGQPKKESQEDIDRKQAEAYIRLHEAINYWE